MKKILQNLWMIGGSEITHSADAAIYLISFGDEAALIDCGTGRGHDILVANIESCLYSGSRLSHILLTHCHYDHTGGAARIRECFGSVVVAHELDAVYLETGNSTVTAADWYGSEILPFNVDIKITDPIHVLKIGDGTVMAIHWPGHSPGSLIFTSLIDNKLVVFGQDVHGPIHPALLSDEVQYQQSLRNLMKLEADILLEGHYGIISGKTRIKQFIKSFLKP